jgi:glycosyltransferase involved in cell wall biosynthesis
MSYRILYHHRIRADDGQAVHVREMIAALRALGHEVDECALVPKAAAVAAPASGAGKKPSAWQRVALPRAALELLEIGYGRSAARRLTAAGRAARPDFVYERHALHCSAGLRAARALGVPLLLEVNSPMCDEMSKLGLLRFARLARRREREVLAGADRVLAVSGPLRDRLIELGAVPARTLVNGNGAAIERFDAAARQAGQELRRARGVPAHAFVVGFVGYARAWHRLDLVVVALAQPELAHAQLWIVGEGPALRQLREHAAAAGVADRVHCIGNVAYVDVPAYVCAFDAAVIPAINEYASPLKLFDYLAAGVPVVAPDQRNLRELVADGGTALLFAPRDGGALAAALRRLATDPATAVAIGAAGRRTLLEHAWTWRGAAERVLAAFAAVAR